MVLLWIYIGTILLYYLSLVCCVLDIKSRVPKEIFKKYKYGGNKFSSLVKIFIWSIVPVLNILQGLTILFSEEVRKEVEADIYKQAREDK